VPADPPPATTNTDPRVVHGTILALVLVASFLIKLNHLGHASIKALDESFHALVAKSLLNHPLTPTLIDRPWLAYDYRDWQNNHVWLHKPIVPLWTLAASMTLLGINTLALRLPSAILATAAAWLTYAIGRELLNDRRAALIAAALQAFHPAITSLVHGYVFSDHIDVAFLFWVELAMFFLVRAIRTGSFSWTAAAGAAQGIAFLSKTYPAFVVSGVALLAWTLPLRGCPAAQSPNNADQASSRFRGRHLLVLLMTTMLTAAPWTIYCLIQFPKEFSWEQLQVFRHLTHNVEQWAAPWDRLIFDFSLRIYLWFYPAILIATVLLLRAAWREKHLGLWLLLAWGLGVLTPHTLATSKTMTATLIGWPPFLLLLAVMIVRAIDGDAWCLGGWIAAALLAAIVPGEIPRQGWGYPNPPAFAAIMRQNIWVLWHALIALAVAAAVALAMRREWVTRQQRSVLVIVASLATIFLAGRWTWLAYRVTESNPAMRDRPAFVDLGRAVNASLPDNAVLLLENRQKFEHVSAMFFIDRTVYPVTPETIQQTARDIRAAGGEPFLVTDRAIALTPVFAAPLDGRGVYRLNAD
jgi:4-amino-4-deoxy-L-arabinose transferase